MKGIAINFQLLVTGFMGLLYFSTRNHAYSNDLGLNESCKYRCDLHRPSGWMGKYEMNCDSTYDTDEGKEYCRQDCWKCPNSICDPSIPNIFKCPSTDIEGDCESRCDQHRLSSDLGAYTLKCDETSQDENFGCREDCSKCPNWVCNAQDDRNVYHCPALSIDKECKEICDKVRLRKYNVPFTDPFFADCSEDFLDSTEISKCKSTCTKCPKNVCNPYLNDEWYHCPSLTEPKLQRRRENVERHRKLEGVCKDRCDKFRLGGIDEYKLDCTKLFKTESEIKKCREDCLQCPDVCKPENAAGGPYFHCPASGSRDEEEAQLALLTTGFTATAILAGVLAILLIFMIASYWKLKRQVRPEVREQQPSSAVLQESAVSNYASASELSKPASAAVITEMQNP